MRFAVALVVSLGCLLCAAPARAEDGPATLKELEAALVDLANRLGALVQEAERDPAMRIIEEYRELKPEQLKLKRRKLRAEMLAEIMVDPAKNFIVRQEAQKVLAEKMRFSPDPDFSTAEKQAGMSKRAYWCTKHLLPHLRHDDQRSRALTNELLGGLWHVRNIDDIQAYKADNKRTWRAAMAAWKKFLKKN